MGYIASKIAEAGISHKDFDERYKTYRSRREEIESDPKAPRGAFNLVVRGMTDFAIKSARTAPGVGVFAEYVNEEAAGEALAQGLSYIIDRIGNKDEVALLREPERILTPLFIGLLNKVCEKRRLVLMFDVFERTCQALEPWLLKLLEFDYGEFDTNLTFVISGRDPSSQQWTRIAGSICDITLEPFTEDEARLYLSNRNVTDDQLVTQIYLDTGGLPVLVELLVGTNPKPGMPLPDISRDAVIRFLQWVPEKEKRTVALLAAVPRNFNLDILSAALGRKATGDFDWLSSQSYIRTDTTRGAHYHERVRDLMLRYLRTTTPGELTTAHVRLAAYFEAEQSLLSLADGDAYASPSWQELELERTYHMSCARPTRTSEAVNTFLRAFRWRWVFAGSIVQVYEQAARETGSEELQSISQAFTSLYQAYDENLSEILVVQTAILAHESDLDKSGQATIYLLRGQAHRMMGKFPEALADYDRAVELDERTAEALSDRGVTFMLMDKFPEALADYNRAVELDEKNPWLRIRRGNLYAQMDKFPEALADYNRAIELDERNTTGPLISRAMLYAEMGKFSEALADYNRAVELDETNVRPLTNRGRFYAEMGKFPEALADYNRAVELDETNAWPLTNRGDLYAKMGKFPEALADYDRAVELEGEDEWMLTSRGLIYRLMGKFTKALEDFDRAIALNEKITLPLEMRGDLYRRFHNYDAAIKDWSKAMKLDSDETNSYLFSRRAAVYLDLGFQAEAEADIVAVLALPLESVVEHYNRAVVYALTGELDEAIRLLDEAIKLDALARYYALTDDLLDPLKGHPRFQEITNVA